MIHDVRELGARGENIASDTRVFQQAIDRCAEAGGGMVLVQHGRYRIGSLRLRSNVRLHLEAGSTIIGSPDPGDYARLCPTTSHHPQVMHALFHADDEDDIAITGTGVIQGGGGQALPGADYLRAAFRPCIFHFVGCQRLRLIDLAIRDAWYWTVHLLRCEDVRIRGISIANHRQRLASVGIVPDGSSNVAISDCSIEAGDDAIAIKDSGGGVCENVVVTNCILKSSQSALKIGAQTRGTIRNIAVSNCVVCNSHIGIGVFMKDGGSIDHASFSNLVIKADNEFPICVDIIPRSARQPLWGAIRNLSFSDLMVTGKGRCLVQGASGALIERVAFRNIDWSITGICDGVRAERNRGSEHCDTPDPSWPDECRRPYQFIYAHVHDLHLAQIACHQAAVLPRQDRGLVCLRGVRGAMLADLRGPAPPAGLDALDIAGCEDVACAQAVSLVHPRDRSRSERFEPARVNRSPAIDVRSARSGA